MSSHPELDDTVNRSLALLERCFHLVLHYGPDSDAFRDYKEVQEILENLCKYTDCDESLKDKISTQLARFDWTALNAETKIRAELV
jgi:hypothetical protein